MDQAERRLFLIRSLLKERGECRDMDIPTGEASQRTLLRGLMNVRPAQKTDVDFLRVQDEYLQEELAAKDITDIRDLSPIQPGLYLRQGDITRLRCDAIVNAANSGLTGCYIPCHSCIDNCIHTYAGIQLRLACAEQMALQQCEEPTGRAKITKAYNLPCRYVLHTVGPIIYSQVAPDDERLLASCYRSCLELAEQYHIGSIAFCCISTGVFHFPRQRAAQIAVNTVQQYLAKTNSKMKVIFNVFQDEDRAIYERLLQPADPSERGACRS